MLAELAATHGAGVGKKSKFIIKSFTAQTVKYYPSVSVSGNQGSCRLANVMNSFAKFKRQHDNILGFPFTNAQRKKL